MNLMEHAIPQEGYNESCGSNMMLEITYKSGKEPNPITREHIVSIKNNLIYEFFSDTSSYKQFTDFAEECCILK